MNDENPFFAVTPHSQVQIVKGDANGNAADTPQARVLLPDGTASPVFRVTNTGTEPLADLRVSDAVVTGGTVTGFSCAMSALGGPLLGGRLGRPLPVGASFLCTRASLVLQRASSMRMSPRSPESAR